MSAAPAPYTVTAEALKAYQRRRRARNSLLEFTKYTFDGDYVANQHHTAICDILDRMERGELKRVMVFAPPRHGKSELASRRWPAYLLGKNPDREIIFATYGQELSNDMGRDVRKIMDSKSYQSLFPNTRLATRREQNLGEAIKQVSHFEVVGRKGSYYGVGCGGALTGKGGHFLILDDSVKDREEADSPTIRESRWKWYTSTFKSRQMRDARILIIHTRWDEDDIPGRILTQNPGDWKVFNFEAIRREHVAEGDYDDPGRYDLRSEGEALWPEWFGLDFLKTERKENGPYDWSSLYGGRPTPPGDRKFHDSWFRYYEGNPPEGCAWFLTLDAAFGTESTHDEASLIVQAVDRDSNQYIHENVHGRFGPERLVKLLADYIMRYKPLSLGLEKGTAVVLKTYLQQIQRIYKLPGCRIREIRSPRGSGPPESGVAKKRIERLVPYYESGRIRHHASLKDGELEKQLLAYPRSKHDDCADSLAYSLDQITPPRAMNSVMRDGQPRLPFWAKPMKEQMAEFDAGMRRQQSSPTMLGLW